MNLRLRLLLLLAPIALAGCELVESRQKGLPELQALEQKWQDGLQLARSTARIALSPQVAHLQSIRRELSPVAVGKCLQTAKSILNEHMELMIKGFMQFMSDERYESASTLELGMVRLEMYKTSRDACSTK